MEYNAFTPAGGRELAAQIKNLPKDLKNLELELSHNNLRETGAKAIANTFT